MSILRNGAENKIQFRFNLFLYAHLVLAETTACNFGASSSIGFSMMMFELDSEKFTHGRKTITFQLVLPNFFCHLNAAGIFNRLKGNAVIHQQAAQHLHVELGVMSHDKLIFEIGKKCLPELIELRCIG